MRREIALDAIMSHMRSVENRIASYGVQHRYEALAPNLTKARKG
jgi:hypothetical protein